MRWFAWWSTDVTFDFFGVQCPKILLQVTISQLVSNNSS
jgi:hypothetical protein